MSAAMVLSPLITKQSLKQSLPQGGRRRRRRNPHRRAGKNNNNLVADLPLVLKNLKLHLNRSSRKRYGVIAFFQDTTANGEHLQFLYMQVAKRYSIGFIEVLLGHFSLDDLGMLVRLIEDMTVHERQRILTENFRDLYVGFWGRWDPTHRLKYNHARNKFEALRTGYYRNHYFYSWEKLMAAAQSVYQTPVKEFPKGRKKKGSGGDKETDFDCAIREFAEETRFEPSSYVLIPYTKPFEMRVLGMDGLVYENSFYVVKFHQKENVDTRQSSETTGVCWLTYEEAMGEIRPQDEPQRQLLQRVNDHLQNLYVVAPSQEKK